MPKRFCLDCKQLFDRDATGTQRCPACQPAATAARNARGNTTQRGYGSDHQALRAELAAAFQPGQPCVSCGQPIASIGDADLGHGPGQQGYRGLQCRRCNRGAPSRDRGRRGR